MFRSEDDQKPAQGAVQDTDGGQFSLRVGPTVLHLTCSPQSLADYLLRIQHMKDEEELLILPGIGRAAAFLLA